jgi:hypothetical protein
MIKQTIVHELMTAAEENRLPHFAIRPLIRVGAKAALAIGLDNGNDAIKAAVLQTDGALSTIRVPTAYRDAEVVRSGRGEVSYTHNGQTFWIGETALRHQGGALPIGPTKQRLIDPRQRATIGATIVELLHQAGYEPGEHTVVLGFAIPNGEIERQQDEAGAERLDVEPETRKVMEQYLKGVKWDIIRTDPQGVATSWTIRVITVLPQPQTAGTIIVCTKAPNGRTVVNFDECEVIDIGGGDLQSTNVTISDYQLISRRLGDGMIRLARALKDKFPRMHLNDVAAQHALVTKQLLVSGKWRDISAQVQEVVSSQGQEIVADALPQLVQSQRFVILTGGGVILLHDLLQERLSGVNKVHGEDYVLINHSIASVLNAVGSMFGVIYKAAKKD